MIDYATNRLAQESLEDPAFATFACSVNGPEAMAWLDENRPDAVAMVQARQGTAASEALIVGMENSS